MIGLRLKSMQAGFFDRDAVLRKLGPARRKALNEMGRRVRKAAQKSLVYGTASSPPGRPPTAHKSRMRTRTSKSTGRTRTRPVSFLREFLFFSYDSPRESVVVGPARLNSTVDPDALPALEYGGTSTIFDHGKRRSVGISARPFMGPALAAEAPNFPDLWRDSVL